MKIKLKFLIGITAIVFIFGLALNLSMRYILMKNMETSVTTALNQLMYSTRESIKYGLSPANLSEGESTIEGQGDYLTRNISSNFQCTAQLINANGQIIRDNTKEKFKAILLKGTSSAKEGSAVVNLKYENKELYGILSYPIYIEGERIGILNIVKNYTPSYENIRQVIIFITTLEGLILICIFIFAYILISKITSPIIKLTEGVKEVGKGDYSFSIDVKGRDEISLLLREFIHMKEMIKEQIETIREEKEKVETLVKGRKSFFDNVTHEMKTPLTAISGYAEMLLEERVKDEDFNKRALQRIYLESERLHNLIIDLIKVSKGLSYTKEELKPINLQGLIEEITEDMRIKAGKHFIGITTNLKPGYTVGQENKIREVVINVLDNAIKYSREETIIEVIGSCAKDKYVFVVESHSGVIPSHVFENILEPFVKCNKFTESESRGLGLYLCNEIIKDHDGTIEIFNGEKVLVKVTLPMKAYLND